MFTGRAADPAEQRAGHSGRAALRGGAQGDLVPVGERQPYADWIPDRVYQSLSGIRSQMGQVIEARRPSSRPFAAEGFALSVLASRSPVTVELGFRSPYGYATAEAIVEFDYHVRMVKTLVLKDRMSDEGGQGRDPRHRPRPAALFLEPIRWERNLLREEDAPAEPARLPAGRGRAARQRVRAAVALFGELPQGVHRRGTPRHSQRRVTPDRGGTAVDAARWRSARTPSRPPPSAGQLL